MPFTYSETVSEPLLTFQQLSYRRRFTRHFLFSNANAQLHCGEIVSLIGANGIGKTTLLLLLAGHNRPSQGNIMLSERLKAPLSLGFMPDNPPLFANWRVSELLWRLAEMRKLAKPEQAVVEAIERCQLNQVVSQQIGRLSYGYQRRVNLAQALLHKPALLLLDEPMNGLDPSQQTLLTELIKSLAAEGTGVILSQHDLRLAASLSHTIWALCADGLKTLSLPASEKGAYWATFSLPPDGYTSQAITSTTHYFSPTCYQKHAQQLAQDANLCGLSQDYPSVALEMLITS